MSLWMGTYKQGKTWGHALWTCFQWEGHRAYECPQHGGRKKKRLEGNTQFVNVDDSLKNEDNRQLSIEDSLVF